MFTAMFLFSFRYLLPQASRLSENANGLDIVNRGTWLRNLSCVFLLAVLVVNPQKYLAKRKRWLCALVELTNRNIVIMYFMHSQ